MSVNFSGNRPQILDCTFRDGGYYNNWDFADVLFAEYLSVLGGSQVGMLEVGFRLPPSRGFRGAHAFSTDAYISSFSLPQNKSLGVMVNSADFSSDLRVLDSCFAPANSSPLDFVRIASHQAEIDQAKEVARALIDKGYSVAINLMQMSEISDLQLAEIAESIDELPLFSFYLADSLGSMRPEGVDSKFRLLAENTEKPMGLHAHDNLGLAFQNSIVAAERGAQYIDGTIRGMGRGPGNTKTEELAISLHSGIEEFSGAQAIGRLSDTTWAELQDRLGWGRNLAYFTAGLMGVHPTYVQELLSDTRYEKSDVLAVIRSLSHLGARRFDKDTLKDASEFGHTQPKARADSVVPQNWVPMKLEEAVILGPGRSLHEYQRSLGIFASDRKEALILCVNDSDMGIAPKDYYRVISHRRQVAANEHFLEDPNGKVIVPYDRLRGVLPDSFKASMYNIDFRLGNQLTIGSDYIESPVDNVFGFACGLAHMAGVKRIFIAGFDGIGAADSRDFDMADILKEVQKNWGLEVVSLTPTKLPVEVASPLSFRPHSVES